jgi:hypothetical protein
MARTKSSADHELAAISSILQALNDLDGESIQRVLDYVFGRLSIAPPRHVKAVTQLLLRILNRFDQILTQSRVERD